MTYTLFLTPRQGRHWYSRITWEFPSLEFLKDFMYDEADYWLNIDPKDDQADQAGNWRAPNGDLYEWHANVAQVTE